MTSSGNGYDDIRQSVIDGWQTAQEEVWAELSEQHARSEAARSQAQAEQAEREAAARVSLPTLYRVDAVVGQFLSIVVPRLPVVRPNGSRAPHRMFESSKARVDAWHFKTPWFACVPECVTWTFRVRGPLWDQFYLHRNGTWHFSVADEVNEVPVQRVVFGRDSDRLYLTTEVSVDWVGAAQKAMAAYLVDVGLPLPS